MGVPKRRRYRTSAAAFVSGITLAAPIMRAMRRYDIVTFDCYGTLIDWESGIAKAFRDAGLDDRDAVLRAYAEHEPIAEEPPFRPYREVLGDVARRVAHALGPDVADTSFLAESLPSWTPFPDTNGALERLRAAGYRLGILSNVDDDLLAATRRLFTVDFDLVVTAQQVRSYKPRHARPSATCRGCTRRKATSTTSCRRTRCASRTPGSTVAARRSSPAACRRSASSATSRRSPARSPDQKRQLRPNDTLNGCSYGSLSPPSTRPSSMSPSERLNMNSVPPSSSASR